MIVVAALWHCAAVVEAVVSVGTAATSVTDRL
jgi:hypothetical protein